MVAMSWKLIVQHNFQLLIPPKFGSPVHRNGKWKSAIMKKWENGCHVIENHHIEKFPITNPPPAPKVWVSTFLNVSNNGKWALAIIKKCYSQKLIAQKVSN